MLLLWLATIPGRQLRMSPCRNPTLTRSVKAVRTRRCYSSTRVRRPSVGPARWSSAPTTKYSWSQPIRPTRSKKASEYGRTEGVLRQRRQDAHGLVHGPIAGVRLRRDRRRSRTHERPRWARHRLREAQLLCPRLRLAARGARNRTGLAAAQTGTRWLRLEGLCQ